MRKVNQPHPHTLPSALRELDGTTRGPSSGRSRSPKALGVARLHKARWRRELPFLRAWAWAAPHIGYGSDDAVARYEEFSDNGLRYIDLGETLDDINFLSYAFRENVLLAVRIEPVGDD